MAAAERAWLRPDMGASGVDAILEVGGRCFLACPSGALIDPDDRIVIVADLHLEKSSSYARRGQLLPPYDTAATLLRLAAVVAHHAPRLVVALGDSFHDRGGPDRLDARDREMLARLQAGRDWLWLAGNHDPDAPAGLAGRSAAELRLGAVALRHEPDAASPTSEIAGHLHPVAVVAGRSGAVRRRCFLSDGWRCIMPAFGSLAGGLNIHHAAFTGLFGSRHRFAHALGRDRVYAIPMARCLRGA